ncbi:glycoside hydrolase family 3 N-terminal domain-containing protein [Herpetosiphon giganteus]|uniref:glycoside hydrolase family 3 N-terminal domain-containing protein n=1 Tax=Herpetosiphon giganteus TaxID=2029754 RepID=UPI00195E15CA|nr:glycoside hydrolase family 3 N-terminal domain-containing protein [Herpetosiphon giganteus]MBM7843215.1 beta-glucosidase [Herpetosiphon giganteus]
MQYEQQIEALLAQMTLAEKIGQMRQLHGTGENQKTLVREGNLGSVLNVIDAEAHEIQRIAVEESRLGIPLLIGRDVIHGFRTIFPIPLGQAASFNPDLVREAARVAAREASGAGINWTFAPMIDIARDPRWGRIAESCGEDAYLASLMGVAMVEGFQGDDLTAPEAIAACAKHYVGYGASENGRDYNTAWIPEVLLRDVYLAPFHAAAEAGAATFMSAFNDLNGVPTSGNEFTLRQILKGEWAYDGMVVSDWASIVEMIAHGYAADARDAALKGVQAGVDMEMASTSYAEYLAELVESSTLSLDLIDDAVRRVLRIKFRLGLFNQPYANAAAAESLLAAEHLDLARQIAKESCVLLSNKQTLPLSQNQTKVAIVGPLANHAAYQLGCWVFDGKPEDSQTPLQAIRALLGDAQVVFAQGLAEARSTDHSLFDEAVAAAQAADVVLAFLGEDAGLSGEAHSRAFIDLPGAQLALIDALVATGKPVVAVVMAGRSLVLGELQDKVQAMLYAWHPGTMAGPAIADLLFGLDNPSGRLPISFPRTVGQVPVYYNRKNTGRPPSEDAPSIPTGTPLDPSGFTSSYLDVDHRPLFAFGYGLSYTTFEYSNLRLSSPKIGFDETLSISATITNTGKYAGSEVVQLYIRDLVGSMTRPIKELKGFQRIALEPGQSQEVTFELRSADLSFHNNAMQKIVEPGEFHVWVAPSSIGGLQATFELTR